MTIPELVKWAKVLETNLKTKKVQYPEKYMPKIDAYTRMIIDRGEIIIKDTGRMNRFMEDINEATKRLQLYGVNVPNQELPTK